MVLTRVDRGLALDKDTCVHILRECGYLPRHGVGTVNLGKIPNGLNAKETERFLRENGALVCGLNGAQFL
jgi:hypothetical protein